LAITIRAKYGKGASFEWDRANELVSEIDTVLALLPEEREPVETCVCGKPLDLCSEFHGDFCPGEREERTDD
jgi:hypothetical protein